ncbi:leucine-rich_repeat protein [Hexamita inflata]|uniref:Leucine-rich repeat protein n=1 Tax=Hexamita inflata TaxID=28002 RepID=A0AA86R399_9EUKA|nr:leucine-rich repeat protein [Hexamita inflata]
MQNHSSIQEEIVPMKSINEPQLNTNNQNLETNENVQQPESTIVQEIIELENETDVQNYCKLLKNGYEQSASVLLKINQNINQLNLSGIYSQQCEKILSQLKELIELNLSSNNLTTLPEQLNQMQYLQTLDLSYSNFDNLDILSSLTNLQKLNMSFTFNLNQQIFIEELTSLVNLQQLNVRGNQISGIESLASLVNLQQLDVSRNEISSIKSLVNLVELQLLDISDNQIKSLNGIEHMKHLTYLRANNNSIRNMLLSGAYCQKCDQQILFQLKMLKELHLSSNDLTIIPEQLLQMINLEILDLSANKITNIDSLSELSHLQELYISLNMNLEIQKPLMLLNLRILNISNTLIYNIDSLSNLVSLQQLNVSGNNISSIESLASLVNLQQLNVSVNQITKIESLASLVNLQQLDVSRNEISSIKSLVNLVELQLLDISDNQIKSLNGIEHMKHLTYLRANNNSIRNMLLSGAYCQKCDQQILFQLKMLKELHLSSNDLTIIPEQLLQMINLEILDLSANKITNIDSLSELSHLQELYISLNMNLEIQKPLMLLNLRILNISNTLIYNGEFGQSSAIKCKWKQYIQYQKSSKFGQSSATRCKWKFNIQNRESSQFGQSSATRCKWK